MKCRICDKQLRFHEVNSGVHSRCLIQARETEAVRDVNKVDPLDAAARVVLLTTETAHDLPVAERLGIVVSEVVGGVNILKDFAAGFRNIVGGRSGTTQNALKDLREQALAELQYAAAERGADAVVGVDLDYNDIGGSGSTMLMIVASGTAVKLS